MNKANALTVGLGSLAALVTANADLEAKGNSQKTDIYAPMFQYKIIPTLEQVVNTKRAPYVHSRNGVEYIDYDARNPVVKYYSNVDKKTNTVTLQPNQCVYDGFIIEGEGWFREDVIKSLDLLRNNCREQYDTIRNGVIDDNGKYHKGCRKIRQFEGTHTMSNKINDAVVIGKCEWSNRKTIPEYLKYLADGIANEAHRLVYFDEWFSLPNWQGDREGVKISLIVLKKLNAPYNLINRYENLIKSNSSEEYWRKWHGR